MRHGKAEHGAGLHDHERPLAERGAVQARLVGEYLASQQVRVGRVLVSDALRTQQTWQQVESSMPDFDGEATFHDEIYLGGPAEVVNLLREVEDRHTVTMVIGHEPTMASIVSLLADDGSDAGAVAQARIGMPTGAVGVLSGALEHWSELREESLTLHTIVRS